MSDIEQQYHRVRSEYGNATDEPAKDFVQTQLGAMAADIEEIIWFGDAYGIWDLGDDHVRALEDAREQVSGVSGDLEMELERALEEDND